MSEERAKYRTGCDEIRPEALLEFAHPDYSPPTTMEIRKVLKMLGLTGSKAGELLGVGGRTIRKWTGGQNRMPYSAWRLLIIKMNKVLTSS